MSIAAVLLQGVCRGAFYAALLFTFDGSMPAAAHEVAPLKIDGSVAESGLTLAAHHVDVHAAGDLAAVRTQLLLRNDTSQTVSAQYMFAHPARLARGDAFGVGALDEALCDDDLSSAAAELAEAAEPPQRLAQRHDVIVVPAGEQVTVEVEREVPIVRVGAVHRLSLPLPVDRDAPWVPRFSADVLVQAERPIRRLVSPSHRALVGGIGDRAAMLSIDGFVYRQPQLTVEFELDPPARGEPVLALETVPASSNR